MEELIPISDQNGKSAVNARHLHSFLGCKKDFSNWIKHRIQKYGFIEGKDFTLAQIVERGNSGAQTKIEYALTINCAKELAMVEGNEKGKQARQYFIACEQRLKEQAKLLPQTFSEALMLAARQAEQIELQTRELQTAAPKVQYFDNVLQSNSTRTMTQVAKELGMSAQGLEKELYSRGVIFRQSGQWMLYSKYAGKGYAKTRTHHYYRSDGSTGTNSILVWTEYGREFIHRLLSVTA
jgi:anti-repressor protein